MNNDAKALLTKDLFSCRCAVAVVVMVAVVMVVVFVVIGVVLIIVVFIVIVVDDVGVVFYPVVEREARTSFSGSKPGHSGTLNCTC